MDDEKSEEKKGTGQNTGLQGVMSEEGGVLLSVLMSRLKPDPVT